MSMGSFQCHLNICRADVDTEVFGAALAIDCINHLILNGGSEIGRPEWDTSVHPNHIENFVKRAVVAARKMGLFEQEWLILQQTIPLLQRAWERGQALFQIDLDRATTNHQEMSYLSLIDFAVDCYAYISARNTYPSNTSLQAWAINGYMVVWRQHFLSGGES